MYIWEAITHYNPDFEIFGMVHLLSVLIMLAIGIILIWWGKLADDKVRDRIFQLFSFLITASILFWWLIEVQYERFEIETDLPLIFCNLIGLLLPIFTFTKNRTLFNIIFYLTAVGATQAIITPGVKFNFPHYEAIKFWLVHGGLLIIVCYMILVYRILPTQGGLSNLHFHSNLCVGDHVR